jgi:citrate lyase subunit beta/citryl-CoA lyase
MGLSVGRIKLEILIESAEAVLHAEQIARCTSRVGGLVFGLVDFAGDIGAQELGAEQFFYYNYAKSKCIVAARAAGITVVDGVTLAIRDAEACSRDARMGNGRSIPRRSILFMQPIHPILKRLHMPGGLSKPIKRQTLKGDLEPSSLMIRW